MSRADGVFLALCIVVGTVGGVALVSAAYWIPAALAAVKSAVHGVLWGVVVIAEVLR